MLPATTIIWRFFWWVGLIGIRMMASAIAGHSMVTVSNTPCYRGSRFLPGYWMRTGRSKDEKWNIAHYNTKVTWWPTYYRMSVMHCSYNIWLIHVLQKLQMYSLYNLHNEILAGTDEILRIIGKMNSEYFMMLRHTMNLIWLVCLKLYHHCVDRT